MFVTGNLRLSTCKKFSKNAIIAGEKRVYFLATNAFIAGDERVYRWRRTRLSLATKAFITGDKCVYRWRRTRL